MPRVVLVAALAASAVVCQGQDASLALLLNFEGPALGERGGWSGGPSGTLFIDDTVVHGGKHSGRVERDESSSSTFSTFTKSLPIEFAGKSVQMRGWLRLENVTGFAGLWMREDGDAPNLAFDNMQRQQVSGTRDWQEYSISLPIRPEAKQLFFGVLMNGNGKLWVDDLQLLVDGKPIWDVPRIEKPKTQLDLDHEFDRGSGNAITKLSDIQVANLALLAKVWGFLKYHHPTVTAGKRHWDYDLFRVLPPVLAAPDRESAERTLVKWIDGLGEVPACQRCANIQEKDLVVRPDIAWISDARLLAELRARLEAIYKNRETGQQFYVGFNNPGVRNPTFEHELSYAGRIPDAGFQLLALFRYWNIIRYWSPNREIVGADWDAVLAEFIPKVALAVRVEDYKLQMMSLIVRVNDTHANLWSSLDVRPPIGACKVGARVRFVEGQPVVIEGGPELKTGDVIEELDGVPVPQRVKEWTPYYADPMMRRGCVISHSPCCVAIVARRQHCAFGAGPRR